MSPTRDTPVAVTLTVKVGDQEQVFDAVAATNADPYEIAKNLACGLNNDATRWCNNASLERRRGNT